MAEVNILQNGALNGEIEPFRGQTSQLTPAHWAPWWAEPVTDAPNWQNQMPHFDGVEMEGVLVARIQSPFATHTAGLFQQVPAVAGEPYELNVAGQAWSSEAETEGRIRHSSDVNLQIGLDPTGGTDAQSPVIAWSKLAQPLGKWEVLRLTATAQASIITVFLKSAPRLPKRQQVVFWRDASLRPSGRYKRSVNIVGAGDTHIRLEPERPHPPQRVQITASSQYNHKYVELIVQHPNGEMAFVTLKDSQREDDRHCWLYEIDLEDEGLYDVRFVGDRGARLLAQRLLKVAREVQIVPSGKARLDYKRVYILLPPTADATWFAAAARGGFVGRYTIGFSVDDAGVGDVSERVVISVNPHHWPATLTAAWYQQHYPGTRFIPLVANKPDDLEAWLSEWVDA